ncbi:hypothetical protein EVG20_g5178 [Dentipellis fragilis]|uniref:coproporphyrinogen oxidase n=1 Tax=Dentipellis fragilis TaxID=205917 RepID=A0A4Y9YVZ9_9AGAM|nr:hypothetical protein EVG20_g5178 [Dentipellis fragilis]
MRTRVADFVLSLQDKIVTSFEELDPSAPPFLRDSWKRAKGGHGISCVFQLPYGYDKPTTLEKAGVNVSVIHGTLPPAAIKQMRVEHASVPYDPQAEAALPFFAAGISLIIHPRNPHAPTVHANYRYFEITAQQAEGSEQTEQPEVLAWWFGGGCDLTPSYLYEEDAVHFHRTLKDACDPHGAQLYPAFKKWCDEYFFITHRKEARGIGGIFFDDLCADPHKRLPNALEESTSERPWTKEDIFSFVKSAGEAFLPSYLPVLKRRADLEFTPEQRRWQLVRRGRYVEFNLVYDRGTKFGLLTPEARIESILLSLPSEVRWEYMCEVGTEESSEEAKLLAVLTKPREWL